MTPFRDASHVDQVASKACLHAHQWMAERLLKLRQTFQPLVRALGGQPQEDEQG